MEIEEGKEVITAEKKEKKFSIALSSSLSLSLSLSTTPFSLSLALITDYNDDLALPSAVGGFQSLANLDQWNIIATDL